MVSVLTEAELHVGETPDGDGERADRHIGALLDALKQSGDLVAQTRLVRPSDPERVPDISRRSHRAHEPGGVSRVQGIEICEPHDSFTPSKAIVDRMVDEALKADLEYKGKKYGLVLDIGGYYKNVITLAPALTISHEEIDLGLALLDQLMTRVSKS